SRTASAKRASPSPAASAGVPGAYTTSPSPTLPVGSPGQEAQRTRRASESPSSTSIGVKGRGTLTTPLSIAISTPGSPVHTTACGKTNGSGAGGGGGGAGGGGGGAHPQTIPASAMPRVARRAGRPYRCPDLFSLIVALPVPLAPCGRWPVTPAER